MMNNITMSTNLGHLDDFISISPPRIRRLEQKTMDCPRCGSINTKFCYYNNYSKTQPRHYCKACKRHWTKGGTLRNVPTGGGRGRRTSAARKHNNNNNNKKQQKIKKADIITTTQTQIPDPLPFRVSHEFSYHSLGSFNVSLMDIALNLEEDLSQQQFSFSSLSSFENNISSFSATSTSADHTYNNYAEMIHATSSASAALVPDQPWPNCWNLEDIDTLVSSHELNIIPNCWDIESPLV